MKCTSCKSGLLKPTFIDTIFRGHTCTSCGGNWILIQDYVSWKEKNPQYQFAENISEAEVSEATDSKSALLCPISGAIMQKFKITAACEHRLDYSVSVGGLWLDKGEWELLKSEGLAGSLNAVVTRQWQKKIRQESARQSFQDLYRAKFGEELYEEVRKTREWLQSQTQQADIRAYLLAEDPYSAER
ncbi:zf-TFIIB domain-containing protein [Microbulbifer aestuariivivens]|uniref:TFIIB-type zinc ribbon-containing protein n=1 Tax=Microbulbifer aestuariivivens TaxID=1908308 RepID=UPI0031EB8E1D